MKKTEKAYEAPVTEMLEIQMPDVLMASTIGRTRGGADDFTQGSSW